MILKVKFNRKDFSMTNIRMFSESDGTQVQELFKQLTKKAVHFDAHACFSDESLCSIVIENDVEKIIGFGCLVMYRVPTKGIVGRIEDIVVHENFRGNGFGRDLLYKLLLLAKNHNIGIVSLTSNPSRVVARALYTSLGFKLKETGVFEICIN